MNSLSIRPAATLKRPSEQLKQLPASPGVYLFKDAGGDILYIGKAASLRNRVGSYFIPAQKLTPKLKRLMARVSNLDFFVTSSEQEALILELNLIKRHRPPYNVQLKDDKTFPYLKMNLNEDWPRLCITRRPQGDGARYFGPFTNARSVRQTLKVIKHIFPLRNCSRVITGTDSRPCLEYHMAQCLAPCIGKVNRQEYARVAKQVVLFLEGKQARVVRELENRMNAAAEALQFEKAALLRDRIQAINNVIEDQKIAARVRGEQDAIAFIQDRDQAYVQVFFVRRGRLIGRESFVLQGTRSEEPPQIMTSFIEHFYHAAPYIPPLLLLQYTIEDKTVTEDWLGGKRGGRVRIQVPQRGSKKQLMDIVADNARHGLEQMKAKQPASPSTLSATLDEIKRELNLPRTPARMEGYDISNIQGKAAVGSMVVFDQGKPRPIHYRRFRIKTVSGADDYAMLQEVLGRRFRHAAADGWEKLPDLVLIDGGRGQLNAALAALSESGAGSVPVASLAKENEELFIPGLPRPITLPGSSHGLQMLQRLRDESHRFALSYHRRVHKKESLASALDDIPGIGPKRRSVLLKRFGSVRAIAEAQLEDLSQTAGISKRLAENLKERL